MPNVTRVAIAVVATLVLFGVGLLLGHGSQTTAARALSPTPLARVAVAQIRGSAPAPPAMVPVPDLVTPSSAALAAASQPSSSTSASTPTSVQTPSSAASQTPTSSGTQTRQTTGSSGGGGGGGGGG